VQVASAYLQVKSSVNKFWQTMPRMMRSISTTSCFSFVTDLGILSRVLGSFLFWTLEFFHSARYRSGSSTRGKQRQQHRLDATAGYRSSIVRLFVRSVVRRLCWLLIGVSLVFLAESICDKPVEFALYYNFAGKVTTVVDKSKCFVTTCVCLVFNRRIITRRRKI
jgi:hypothetical protein